MTTYEIDILKRALLKVEQKEIAKFDALPDEDVEFSAEFESKIEKLAHNRKKLIWQATKTIPRRILASVLITIITFCLMMTISAIRKPVVSFFVNVYEDFVEIFTDKDESAIAPDSIENIYSPSYIMKDYTQISSVSDNLHVKTIWIDPSGNVLILEQGLINSSSQSNIDNEGTSYSKLSINSMDVYYMTKNGQYLVVWTNNYYMFQIICSDQLDLAEIERFIAGLTISN